MKRVKVFSSISQFESFINNPEYSIIDVKVDSCEQSSSFQECFIGVVFYEDAPLDNNESVPSASSNSDYAAVLEKGMKQFFDKKDFPISNYNIRELAAHLNSAIKASQNCA